MAGTDKDSMSKSRAEVWDKAEKLLKKGNPESALEALREMDGKGEHATTLRLAGIAIWDMAKESGSKSDYRRAVGLLDDAVKLNPRDKACGSIYNNLRNEMQDKGISETLMPKLFIAGAPTPAGLIAIVGGVLLIVAVAKVVSDSNDGELTGDVLMEITWTDTAGVDHNGKIWITLDDRSAPMHAKSFRENVNAKRYDGVIFHRVIDDFMIQTGDFENGDGSGGHAGAFFGYCSSNPDVASDECKDDETKWVIPAEFGNTHDPGVLAAARSSSENSAGSQFYLVDSNGAYTLDGQYTAFGKAYKGQIDGADTTGVEVIDQISQVSCGGSGQPCAQGNEGPTYPVTVVSASLLNVEASWWQFW